MGLYGNTGHARQPFCSLWIGENLKLGTFYVAFYVIYACPFRMLKQLGYCECPRTFPCIVTLLGENGSPVASNPLNQFDPRGLMPYCAMHSLNIRIRQSVHCKQ